MYEHRTTPLLPWPAFLRRVVRHGLKAGGLVILSLIGGTWGFWFLAGEEPVDAFLNSAMLLGGMGPVGEIRYVSGKLFAAGFALYAGLLFLVVASIIVAPLLHRFLHTFHLEDDSPSRGPRTKGQ